jgi:hypothetical protein
MTWALFAGMLGGKLSECKPFTTRTAVLVYTRIEGEPGFARNLRGADPAFVFFSYFPPQHFHTISIDSACWCGVIMPLTMTYKQRDWTKLLIITVVFATALLAVLRGVPKGSGVALCGLLVAVGVCMKRITGHYFK